MLDLVLVLVVVDWWVMLAGVRIVDSLPSHSFEDFVGSDYKDFGRGFVVVAVLENLLGIHCAPEVRQRLVA